MCSFNDYYIWVCPDEKMLIVSNHKMVSEIYGANNFQELLFIESEDLTKWCPVVVLCAAVDCDDDVTHY